MIWRHGVRKSGFFRGITQTFCRGYARWRTLHGKRVAIYVTSFTQIADPKTRLAAAGAQPALSRRLLFAFDGGDAGFDHAGHGRRQVMRQQIGDPGEPASAVAERRDLRGTVESA
jgi:hypothetical protein